MALISPLLTIVALLSLAALSGGAAIAPSLSAMASDCGCSVSSPESDLRECQSVTGTFGCLPGVCNGSPNFCRIIGSISTSGCLEDAQVVVFSTVGVHVPGTTHNITANEVPINCGATHVIAINFCESDYGLPCEFPPSGWWKQTISCLPCPQ
jgi:hypothetical protein